MTIKDIVFINRDTQGFAIGVVTRIINQISLEGEIATISCRIYDHEEVFSESKIKEMSSYLYGPIVDILQDSDMYKEAQKYVKSLDNPQPVAVPPADENISF